MPQLKKSRFPPVASAQGKVIEGFKVLPIYLRQLKDIALKISQDSSRQREVSNSMMGSLLMRTPARRFADELALCRHPVLVVRRLAFA